MSKTQEKRARRLAEQQAFIKARRQQELVLLEMQFQRGLELYEANKDKMSEEEIEIMEREKQKFLDTLAEFKKENGLGEEEKNSN
jgi:hypothetical protein